MSKSTQLLSALAFVAILPLASWGQLYSPEEFDEASEDHMHSEEAIETHSSEDILGCIKATLSQIKFVNLGNDKKDDFLERCSKETNGSFWCNQLVQPNINSASKFRCTYGSQQVHQLIHPSESTWKYPITGVKVLQELAAKGIRICRIYNWWRPEPYNKNVGGAAGRHPYGTAIDVNFCTKAEANRAFRELCKLRAKKIIRALGHYGSASVHIGVGDRLANTWGKSCN